MKAGLPGESCVLFGNIECCLHSRLLSLCIHNCKTEPGRHGYLFNFFIFLTLTYVIYYGQNMQYLQCKFCIIGILIDWTCTTSFFKKNLNLKFRIQIWYWNPQTKKLNTFYLHRFSFYKNVTEQWIERKLYCFEIGQCGYKKAILLITLIWNLIKIEEETMNQFFSS